LQPREWSLRPTSQPKARVDRYAKRLPLAGQGHSAAVALCGSLTAFGEVGQGLAVSDFYSSASDGDQVGGFQFGQGSAEGFGDRADLPGEFAFGLGQVKGIAFRKAGLPSVTRRKPGGTDAHPKEASEGECSIADSCGNS
jgi:hypothetical protein